MKGINKNDVLDLYDLRRSAQEAKQTVELLVQAIVKDEDSSRSEGSQCLTNTYEELRSSTSVAVPDFISLSDTFKEDLDDSRHSRMPEAAEADVYLGLSSKVDELCVSHT